MRIVPLVRAEPGEYEEHEADHEVGRHHVDPYLRRERGVEREETGALLLGLLEEDADTKIHEWLGEVNDLLPDPANGQRCYSQISFLKYKYI